MSRAASAAIQPNRVTIAIRNEALPQGKIRNTTKSALAATETTPSRNDQQERDPCWAGCRSRSRHRTRRRSATSDSTKGSPIVPALHERFSAAPRCGTVGVVIHRRPSPISPLALAPSLESWDKTGSYSQVRLAHFLDHFEGLVGQQLASEAPLAVDLVVGLPGAVSLTAGGRDLDIYLYPIVRRLGHRCIDAAFAMTRHKSLRSQSVRRWSRPKPRGSQV